MGDVIAKIMPILLLISLGYYLRHKNALSENTIVELKKIVINIGLSAVLFLSFLNMELRIEYFFIFLVIFLLLIVLYFAGIGLNRIRCISHPLLPFMTTAFAFGLLGIPLFATVFGMENIEKLSVFGVGHEFFVWTILYTLLRMKFKNERFSAEAVAEMIKSPLILSIVFGIIFNLVGLGNWIQENAIAKGVYITMEYLSTLTTPMILIIVGFGLRFNKRYMKQSAIFIIIRMAVILIIGYTFKYFIINPIMEPDVMFDYAYFTFLILPPPFSLPIIVGAHGIKEHEELVNNTVVVSTVVTIIIYTIFVFVL